MEQTISAQKRSARQSGIELLKIVAMFLIVVSHVVQPFLELPLGHNIDFVSGGGSISLDINSFILLVLRCSGALGNTMFFTCSAFFLIDKNKTNFTKLIRMMIDVFIISILWLITFVIAHRELLNSDYYLHSFFPTFFENNWYITGYILFSLAAPFINIIIKNINKKTHLIIVLSLLAAYFVIGFFYMFPWASTAILWITIYFSISYLKIYRLDLADNKKVNVVVLLSSIGVHILFLFLATLLSKNLNTVPPIKFIGNNNILLLAIAVTSFNLVRNMKFSSRVINYIASMTLFIYLIHNNLLFREIAMPNILRYFFDNFGMTYIVGWLMVIALTLFFAAVILSIIYHETIKRVVDIIYSKIVTAIKNKSVNHEPVN